MSHFSLQEIKHNDYVTIKDACLLLRVVGGITSGVSAILLVSNVFAWLGMMMSGSYDMMDTLTESIVGHSMRLIVFLFAYVLGTALPILVKPAKHVIQHPEEDEKESVETKGKGAVSK